LAFPLGVVAFMAMVFVWAVEARDLPSPVMQSSSFANWFSDELINGSQRSMRCVVLMRKSTDLLLNQMPWGTIRELPSRVE
jgi:hypothetical protein